MTTSVQQASGSPASSASLSGKVVLVVGASAASQERLCLALCDAGAALMLAASEAAALQPLVQKLRSRGGQVKLRCGDLAHASNWQALMSEAQDQFGGVDILIHCVDIRFHADERDGPDCSGAQSLIQNLSLGMQHAMQTMCPQGDDGRGGRIINLVSLHDDGKGWVTEGQWAQAATVQQMSRIAAQDYRRLGYEIRVHCVVQKREQNDGTGRDVTAAVLFLSSEATRGVTSSELVFDGDQHAA